MSHHPHHLPHHSHHHHHHGGPGSNNGSGTPRELGICESMGGEYVWASTTEFPDGWPALSVPRMVESVIMPSALFHSHQNTGMTPVLLLGLPDYNAAYINDIQSLDCTTLFPLASKLIKSLIKRMNIRLCQQGVDGLYYAFRVAEPVLKQREHLVKETVEMLFDRVVSAPIMVGWCKLNSVYP